ncbi:MAG TPA: hypothetical protein VK659_25635 [Asanoa sp.]|nr:hypothetical protein [Asanoa sp.]
MSQTPEQIAAATHPLAEDMRGGGNPYAYVVGWIRSSVDRAEMSDAEFRADVRQVLAALTLARKVGA